MKLRGELCAAIASLGDLRTSISITSRAKERGCVAGAADNLLVVAVE